MSPQTHQLQKHVRLLRTDLNMGNQHSVKAVAGRPVAEEERLTQCDRPGYFPTSTVASGHDGHDGSSEGAALHLNDAHSDEQGAGTNQSDEASHSGLGVGTSVGSTDAGLATDAARRLSLEGLKSAGGSGKAPPNAVSKEAGKGGH